LQRESTKRSADNFEMLMQQFIIFMNKAQLYYNCPSFKKVKYLF